jgi:hypothetical protein
VATAKSKQRWKERPDDHDYPAAEDYLSLVTDADIPCRIADLTPA